MEFYTPFSNPDGYKKRLSVCAGRSACREPYDAFAQGLSSLRSILYLIAGCSPAPRQGSALHPSLDILHAVPEIQRPQKRYSGASGCNRKFAGGARGSADAVLRRFFGRDVVGQPAAMRVSPRQYHGYQGRSCRRLLCLRCRHSALGLRLVMASARVGHLRSGG